MFPEYTPSVWSAVVGQDRAIHQLTRAAVAPVHAYLFVGPAGSTKDEAARAFAALLLTGIDDADQRDARLALTGTHPDVREFERTGATINKDQVNDIIRNATLAPVEGARKVMVLHDFHLLNDEGAARLLKTIEEPPPSTVFIVLADQVPGDLVTIASRCVRVEFSALPRDVVQAVLEQEGIATDAAGRAAEAAEGNLNRARVLATDPGLMARRQAFADIPHRLDGTGHTANALATSLLELIDAAAAPLSARHKDEVAQLEVQIAASGERGSGRKQLEDRHKRELRRHRTDELRTGLAVVASVYRDALVNGTFPRPDAGVEAVARIQRTLNDFTRNPNELLMLQSLMLDLPAMPGGAH